MSGDYTPQIGDRVRKEGWDEAFYFDVLAIDGDRMWVRHENNTYNSYVIGNYPWVKVQPVAPLPERWMNIYPETLTLPHLSRTSSNKHSLPGRLAVLHIWTDADGVDHAEIERVEQ